MKITKENMKMWRKLTTALVIAASCVAGAFDASYDCRLAVSPSDAASRTDWSTLPAVDDSTIILESDTDAVVLQAAYWNCSLGDAFQDGFLQVSDYMPQFRWRVNGNVITCGTCYGSGRLVLCGLNPCLNGDGLNEVVCEMCFTVDGMDSAQNFISLDSPWKQVGKATVLCGEDELGLQLEICP